MEVHTSDLTAHCPRSVLLRWEGKIKPEYTTALYRGALFDAAATLYHTGLLTGNKPDVGACVREGAGAVFQQSKAENRPFSQAVERDRAGIADDVTELLAWYCARVVPVLGETVGVQVPIRCTFTVDGEDVEFASHLDLVTRVGDTYRVIDWKCREDSHTFASLSRNMQIAMYAVAFRHGSVLLDPGMGVWVSPQRWPVMGIMEAMGLRPFGRAGHHYDDNGEKVPHLKGDGRPIDSVLKWVPVDENRETAIMAEFSTRVRMMRQGMFPTAPDTIGCQVCESRDWCPRFTE